MALHHSSTTRAQATCPVGSDNQFGPQVNTICRSFDFTLLFEDSIFILVPAAIFLLCLPSCWQQLKRQQIKVSSYNLAVQKLALLGILFVLHVLYTAFQTQSPTLHTKASLPTAVINVITIIAAAWTSFMEDQRSIAPSSILILYFSSTTLLALPRLRSLWLISNPDVLVCRGIWTAILAITVLVLFTQSASRFKSLQPSYKLLTKEQLSGFWSRGFFVYLLPLLKVGNAKILEISDLPEVDEALQGSNAGAELQKAIQSSAGRYRVLRAVFKAYASVLLWAIPPRLALSAFTFSQTFLLTATVNFMESKSTPENESYGPSLVGAYVLMYFGIAMSTAVYWRQTVRFLAALRAGLVAITYDQTLALQQEDLHDSAALTLMGTDVERTITSLQSIHETWASILEVGIALWLLGRQLGVPCLIPFAIAISSVVVMIPISTRTGEAQQQWIRRIQKRLAVTSSMLGDIKAMKMLGVSDVLSKIIANLRDIEVKTSLRFRKLIIWEIVASCTPTNIAPFATLAVYAGISVSKNDESLLSAKAFTSLALISLMTSPLLTFCQTMPSILQALGCLKRIDEYCDKKVSTKSAAPDDTSCDSSLNNIELREYNTSLQRSGPLVSFKNATIYRSGASDPILKLLNLDIHRGITAIIGPVGSGKTTLLETMLGRHTCEPSILPLSRAAYAPQTPWIMNESIRQNIIGASEFDPKWYDFVTSSCGLDEDLKNMHGGDSRLAGSKGASLSGGQKQRVALARAVYSKLNLVVLDSPFSGLDTRTLATIRKSLFGEHGHFRQSGRSVILVTNNYEILSHADEVVVLDSNGISARGSYQEISSSMPHIFENLVETHEEATELQMETEQGDRPISSNEVEFQESEPLLKADDFTRQKSSWSVYGYFMKPAGWIMFALIEGLILVMCFSTSYSAVWVQSWVDANEKAPNQHLAYYLGIYWLLCAIAVLGLGIAAWIYFTTMMSQTSMALHADLLNAAVGAPISFFQTTDTGSITNRFSQDLELIDMMLPLYLVNLSESTGSVIVQLVIVCIVGKYLATSIPFIAVAVYFIQSYYLRTSRQVRLLDIEAKAPLYTHFLETIDGIASIHAFGWGEKFRNQGLKKLNSSQKPYYMLRSIQKWLELVVNLLVGAVAVILVATMTSLRSQFSSASAGVALNLILSFNQNLKRAVEDWTAVEVSIGAVQRIQSFAKDTPREDEDEGVSVLDKSTSDWISNGEVQFDEVSVRYDKSPKRVLENISLKINHGEKVAVCGPSGSGKTSFIMAMLRMLNTEGQISISNTNVATVPRSLLRRTVNVIPQDPLLFPGSVRFNIDPHGLGTTVQIEDALRKVRMWNQIEMNGGLDTELEVSQWSVGQKQLLELARALIIKSPILILDEATSSMDWETESIMQSVLDTEFADQTIIAVIHRFRYIDRFDKVILLKQGRLMENDDPKALLAYDSEFRRLYQAWKTD
ncbi:hypothetical protein N7478_001277 [Penicillium angulare]|uniref:uncharacterized protein n=1 Tax=Penicillium angulare TaxID=116970 RepID=UPI002540EE42|nr:uncharacterized protein N7478_001277 [Penicillium angulare]KAJ5292026.1 hypothetical protein N7478_001277 [Penicillium angulare]